MSSEVPTQANVENTAPVTRVLVHYGFSFNCIASTSISETNQVFCGFIPHFPAWWHYLKSVPCALRKMGQYPNHMALLHSQKQLAHWAIDVTAEFYPSYSIEAQCDQVLVHYINHVRIVYWTSLSMCTTECWLNLWMNGNFFNIQSCGQLTSFLGECGRDHNFCLQRSRMSLAGLVYLKVMFICEPYGNKWICYIRRKCILISFYSKMVY